MTRAVKKCVNSTPDSHFDFLRMRNDLPIFRIACADSRMLKRGVKIEEIRKKYPDEWVLVEYEELDDQFHVIKGHVLAHSPSRDEVYKRLSDSIGKNVSVEYTGEVNSDLTVMFLRASAHCHRERDCHRAPSFNSFVSVFG